MGNGKKSGHERPPNLLLKGQEPWPKDPTKPIVSLKNVVKRFDGHTLFDGLNLDIHTGLMTVVTGASGSGKSFLLKLMNGLALPDEGQVLLFGQDSRTLSQRESLRARKRISMMFQNYALLDSLTVEENVAFPLSENTEMSWDDILVQVYEILALLGLDKAGKRLPSELSGGMRKRVSLARAVITQPEVVLFDEPTTGLDPMMVEVVDQLLLDLQQRLGLSSVIISHDMTSVAKLADRLAVLEKGKISAYGTVDEVLEERTSGLIQVFFEGVGRLSRKSDLEVETARKLWPLEKDERPLVGLYGINKSFGDNHVLRDIDFFVPEKKITVLIGGSGSGKSVLMKHIVGLMRADSGRVEVFGQDLGRCSEKDMLELRKRIGLIFQNAALLDAMNVEENVAFPLIERGMKKREWKDIVEAMLVELDLWELRKRMPEDLSSGHRKRTAVARALVTKPELIIYDEPTTGQDPVLARHLDDLIVEVQEKFQVTSLIVSHDMVSAFRIADQVALLHHGQIVAAESPERLQAVKDPIVQDFIFAGSLKKKGL